MALKAAQNAVLLKLEPVYGTDSVPTAANAVRARNVSFDPNPTQALTRDLVKPTLGNVREPQALRHVGLSFDVEIVGGGAVDTPPAYGAALRAAGLAETINALVSVEYDPVSSAEESASVYFNWGGILHKALGFRSSVGVAFEPNAIPLLRFPGGMGLHVDPSDVALPTIDWSGYQKPRETSKDNTPTFSLDGFAAKLRRLEVNLGQQVVFRDMANSEEVLITGRDPRGSVTIEAPALATKNFFAVAKGQADGATALSALQIVHGAVAGQIFQLDAPAVQLVNPRYENIDGVLHLTMDLVVAENAGDDEIKITVK